MSGYNLFVREARAENFRETRRILTADSFLYSFLCLFTDCVCGQGNAIGCVRPGRPFLSSYCLSMGL